MAVNTPDLDAEIVKAAEAFAADEKTRNTFVSIPAKRLIMAVEARRAAMKPRPLSAEEAFGLYASHPGTPMIGMRAVLDAAAERTGAIIDHEAARLYRESHAADEPVEIRKGAERLVKALVFALKPGGQ